MTNTVVWSKDNCPYCVRAKLLLQSKGIAYEERRIGADKPDGGVWTREELLEAAPNARTVPQIWLYGEYIGGCDSLEAYMESHDMWRND